MEAKKNNQPAPGDNQGNEKNNDKGGNQNPGKELGTPEKKVPVKKDDDNDSTAPDHKGVPDPKKTDPTRTDEPSKTDPTKPSR